MTTWPRWATWIVWLLVFVAIDTDVVLHPLKHTTMPTYRTAATNWWQGVDLYTRDSHAGFLYFPQAAVIFTPFNVLPFLAGEILWRAACFGLFAYALVRLHRFFVRTQVAPEKTFFYLSLLAIPSAFASLRNAQFDLPLAALIVLAAAEVAEVRWAAAAAWLCFGLALKPLAVVPVLLFGACHTLCSGNGEGWPQKNTKGRLLGWMAVGLLVVLVIPFLHWSPAYVARQYVACYHTLVWASAGDEPKYSELAALFSKMGYDMPQVLRTVLRLIFALVYLGLGVMAVRRLARAEAAWTIGALSADYLMLFNPRTETCSYVFLGPFVASLALVYAAQPTTRWVGRALMFGAVCLACDAFPNIGHILNVHLLTDRWLKPLVALLFLPVVVAFVLRGKRGDG